MLRVGLTGGIACGKTTVAAMMKELGCRVIDADQLAHAVTEPGQAAYREIVAGFGREVLAADGRINRSKLGAIVFADAERRRLLNGIVHPRVIEEQDRILAELSAQEPNSIAVVEAALLIEAGYHEKLDRLLVVWCRREQQVERLVARGLTPEQAEQRIAAQMPLEEKRRLADDEIDGSGTLERTREQVTALVAKYRRIVSSGG